MSENQPPSPPPFEPEELRARLREMQTCADRFFFHANAIKGTPLLWVSGLLNLYIALGRAAVEVGMDFRMDCRRGELPPMSTREAAFLGSIFENAFGPALRDDAARRAFLELAFPEPSSAGGEKPIPVSEEFFKALEGT